MRAKVYLWYIPSFRREMWSLKEWCGSDFAECTEVKEVELPEGYVIGEDMTGIPHIYDDKTWYDLTTRDGKPYIQRYGKHDIPLHFVD